MYAKLFTLHTLSSDRGDGPRPPDELGIPMAVEQQIPGADSTRGVGDPYQVIKSGFRRALSMAAAPIGVETVLALLQPREYSNSVDVIEVVQPSKKAVEVYSEFTVTTGIMYDLSARDITQLWELFRKSEFFYLPDNITEVEMKMILGSMSLQFIRRLKAYCTPAMPFPRDKQHDLIEMFAWKVVEDNLGKLDAIGAKVERYLAEVGSPVHARRVRELVIRISQGNSLREVQTLDAELPAHFRLEQMFRRDEEMIGARTCFLNEFRVSLDELVWEEVGFQNIPKDYALRVGESSAIICNLLVSFAISFLTHLQPGQQLKSNNKIDALAQRKAQDYRRVIEETYSSNFKMVPKEIEAAQGLLMHLSDLFGRRAEYFLQQHADPTRVRTLSAQLESGTFAQRAKI